MKRHGCLPLIPIAWIVLVPALAGARDPDYTRLARLS